MKLGKLTSGIFLLFSGISIVAAAPITYTLTGTGSGSVNSSSFTNQAVTFNILGDTANRVTTGGGWTVDAPATFNISNLYSGTAVLEVYSSSSSLFIALEPAGGGANLLWAFNGGSPAYNLISNVNYFFSSVNTQNAGTSTSAGNLTISSFSNLTFTASTGTQAPEPTTWLVTSGGAVFLGFLRRWKTVRS